MPGGTESDEGDMARGWGQSNDMWDYDQQWSGPVQPPPGLWDGNGPPFPRPVWPMPVYTPDRKGNAFGGKGSGAMTGGQWPPAGAPPNQQQFVGYPNNPGSNSQFEYL